jgi:hypothetical protein
MRVVLSPVPRLPWRVQRIDIDGRWQGVEIHDRGSAIVSCLRRAFNMMGHDIAFERVSAASGEALRFTWQEEWGHEAEAITPLDAATTACDALGFSYVSLRGESREATLAAIVSSIDDGIPALIGLDRSWELVVGYDSDRQELICDVSGFEQAAVGEQLPLVRSEDELRVIPMPENDWHGATYEPGQVARNPAFLLRGRPGGGDARDEVTQTLRTLISVSADSHAPRRNHALRAEAGSGFLAVDETEFVTGVDAIRTWADNVERLAEPAHDFRVIHANDTTLRLQIERGHDAAKYIAWAADVAPDAMRPHLTRAHGALAEAAAIPLPVCAWTCDLHTPADLQEAVAAEPALVAIVDDDKGHLLGDLEGRAQPCPWGYSLIPEQDVFLAARDAVAAGLRRIADLRAAATTHLELALAAEMSDRRTGIHGSDTHDQRGADHSRSDPPARSHG